MIVSTLSLLEGVNMLLDRSNIKKWLESRTFEIFERKRESTNKYRYIKATHKLSKNRIIELILAEGIGAQDGSCRMTAKMKWNEKWKNHYSTPSIDFHFYLPIEHTHTDKILKMMIKWTKYAFEEYKNKRITL